MTWRKILAGVAAVVVGTTVVVYGERIVWLVQAARFQGELLAGRIPIEEALAAGYFEGEKRERLEQVEAIKAFGRSIGLRATRNYSTINPTWSRTIYNVSAAPPLRLENERWWFPVVGSVPYMGFFDRGSAEAFADKLRERGLDVYVRTAGAYSTLGWFEDPLTPGMLAWPEYRFANTILHELAHATVWIPGSVQFNESFANFVGDEASRRYMIQKYGADSEEVQQMRERIADGERWSRFMHGIYEDLDAIYRDRSLSDEEKLARKAALFASLEGRIDQVGFADPERWKRIVRKRTWNNAAMMQFRVYNRNRDRFRKLYELEGRDLLRFMRRVEAITANADDPYAALAEAVGASAG